MPPSSKRFKIIYLELTNACNFTCDYCPIDRQTRKKEVMPTEFAKHIIDQIAENQLTYFITFHLMGEPYLHKDLALLTGYAEGKGLRVRLLTNGSLLETRRNEMLFENHLSRLEVGFRTPNDTSFSMRLRGGRLTLAAYLRRSKGQLQEHTLNAGRTYGYDTGQWEGRLVPIAPGDYPIFPGIHLAFGRIQEFWVREQRGQSAKQGYPAIIGGCSAGFRDDFGILCSGEVTTCCVDYDGKNVIGDLHQQSLMEVLESAEAKRILKSFKWFIPPTPFCRECRGGATLVSSIAKQASTIAIDVRDRFAPRKKYLAMR